MENNTQKEDIFENFSLQDIIKNVNENKETMKVDMEEDSKSKDEFDELTTKNIIDSYSTKYGTDIKTSIIAITKIVQDGGTNSSRPNMSRTINNITFELADLRQVIRLHDRYGTVRKLAKSMKKIIAAVSIINNWPGTLYKDLQRLNPTLTISPEDSVYCSEFNVDNYDTEMPPRIREALQQREQKVRDERNRYLYQKNKRGKMGRRKRGRTRRQNY